MDELKNLSKDQIQLMIGMLQAMVNEDESPKKPEKEKRPNKFLDMPEFSMHKSDSIIDKQLNVQPPTPRTRSYTPISVTCRVCGKQENINPSLLSSEPSRYKCNKCSSVAG